MTSRLGKPDTPADVELRTRLSQAGVRHFVMVAGAGSGKTTSLIKALNHLSQERGSQMRRQAQQVACITYTEVAVEEISGDVGHDTLFHVSTIHSFLWSVIKPFQSDLHAWVLQKLGQKITEAHDKIDKPRTREATRVKERANIERYELQIGQMANVKQFRYGQGSDYVNGVLGHSDILKLGPALICEHALLQRVVAQRFPVIFVDESQDTAPDFVEALKAVAARAPQDFCLGFFGDPIQKIYLTGAGEIPLEEDWVLIEKPENFRCPTSVLAVINNIRAEADRLEQTRGRTIEQDGVQVPVQGTARLFVLPADERRAERLLGVRAWLSEQNDDQQWLSDEKEGDVRLLVIVHRIAAARLGFDDIYAALNDRAPEALVSGLTDGTAWVVRPFVRFLLPLLQARSANDNFRVMTLLRQYCLRLDADSVEGVDLARELLSLEADITTLNEMLTIGGGHSIGDVINFVNDHNLAQLDGKFVGPLAQYNTNEQVGANEPENSVLRFLNCDASQLWGYQKYVEDESPFATQQGIKGAQFDRVLVVVDDEESTTTTFSYGKYFETIALSDTDNRNIKEGKDSVVDRTRRLFYVCCSRAVQDLAVVVFTDNVALTCATIEAKGYFSPEDVHQLEL